MTIAKNYIDVKVANRFVAVSDHTPITSGNVGVDYLRVTLDDAWGGLDVKVTFLGSKDDPTTVDAGTLTKHTATDGTVTYTCADVKVPWEQITEDCDLYVAFQGLATDSGTEVLNTSSMREPIYVRESGESAGLEPQQPTAGTLQRVEQDIVTLEAGIQIWTGADALVKKVQDAVDLTDDLEDRVEAIATTAAENAAEEAAADVAAAEALRVTAEQGRDAAERQRAAAENARGTAYEQAEAARDEAYEQAEADRSSEFTALKGDMEDQMQSQETEFNNAMDGWDSDVDALLATGSTYEKRIEALEGVTRHDNLSYRQIQEIVKAGVASRYFNVGDQILVPWKDVTANVEYTIPFDICHHFDGSDADHPLATMPDGSKKPGMALMAHYALPFGTSVSGREPFYIVPEGGLAAGTYNVTFTEKCGSNVVAGKTYQFTTDMDCPAGYQLLGFYGAPDQNPSNWRVYVFDDAASAVPLKTYTVSEGNGGTSLGSFKNAAVNGSINALQRVAYAYNNASKSALHQWLNSSAGVGQWWVKQHDCDHIPINSNYSTTKAGFLTGFSEDFLAIVGDVQIKTQGNNNTDGSVIDTYHGKFFPLSARQHYFNNYLSETAAGYEASGVPWDYWKQLAEANGRTAPFAGWTTYPELITYDLAGNHTSACSVWLRSARCSNALTVGDVTSSGNVNSYGANGGARCAPACVIC